MDVLDKIVLGLSVALTPANLLFCFVGTVFGTLVGVLPGFGPVGAFSLLLPLTYKMERGLCYHHACRCLLWGDVWGIDHVYTG